MKPLPAIEACPIGHKDNSELVYRSSSSRKDTGYYVKCNVCGWSGPTRKTKGAAVISWNRRSTRRLPVLLEDGIDRALRELRYFVGVYNLKETSLPAIAFCKLDAAFRAYKKRTVPNER